MAPYVHYSFIIISLLLLKSFVDFILNTCSCFQEKKRLNGEVNKEVRNADDEYQYSKSNLDLL